MKLSLKQRYFDICNEYIKAFEEKNQLTFDGWVSDMIGTTAYFGRYTINFTDIVLDINSNSLPFTINQWQDAWLDNKYYSEYINYSSWIMGARYSDFN